MCRRDSSFITGIAGRKNFSVITITKNGMSNEVGVLRRVLEILEKYQLVVEYLPSGIDSVSLVVAADKLRPCQYQILGEIQKAARHHPCHRGHGHCGGSRPKNGLQARHFRQDLRRFG